MPLVTVPEQPAASVRLEGDESTFTMHGGFGSQFDFGRKSYVRWQSKVRWIDSDVYDDLDIESTIGIGFKFGG